MTPSVNCVQLLCILVKYRLSCSLQSFVSSIQSVVLTASSRFSFCFIILNRSVVSSRNLRSVLVFTVLCFWSHVLTYVYTIAGYQTCTRHMVTGKYLSCQRLQ